MTRCKSSTLDDRFNAYVSKRALEDLCHLYKTWHPVTSAERAAYEALDNLSLTWQRRATKLKQSATQTIQGGITLEQLRSQREANRRTD